MRDLSGEFQQILRRHRVTVKEFNRLAGAEGKATRIHSIWDALYKPVVEWAAEYHLCTRDDLRRRPMWSPDAGEFPFIDWLVQVAGDTLGESAAGRLAARSWNLTHVLKACRVHKPAPEPFVFACEAWPLPNETLAQSTKRVREQFETALREHIGILRQKPKVLYIPRGKEWHFDWLVKYQIQRKRLAEIAREEWPEQPHGKDEEESAARKFQTVKAGVHNAAGWVIGSDYATWLVKGQPGRPPANH